MLKFGAGGKRTEKEEAPQAEAAPVITLTKAVDSVIKVDAPAADEAAPTKMGPNTSSSSYALRLPCKGWRGLGMRGGYKSPRYRHANYIQVIRQQHKSTRTPKMKRGFPPCRYHSQTASIQIMLYTNKEFKTSMISQCVRLCCVVQHLVLKEVEVKSSSLWPFEDLYRSPVLYHRGLRHSDLRSIYMFFAQMWATKHRLSAAHEVRSWMYVGILQELELACQHAVEADSEQLVQVITDPLIRLDKLVSQTQTPEGYIYNKGSLSVLEVFIAGIYSHCASLLGAKEWKQISSRVPAIAKVKNLVFSHASVHRWQQQKKKITCITHPNEWSSKVVLKWLQLKSIEYESHVITKEEWQEKPLKDCVVLPALQVPGNAGPSICGLYAIALWLASRNLPQPTQGPRDSVWEDLGRLEESYNAYIGGNDAKPQETGSLTCPKKTRISDPSSWLVEAAGAVLWEELQQQHAQCVSPLGEQLTLLHQFANHSFRMTEHNSLAQASILVCASDEARRHGLVAAVEAMCRSVPISCQISGPPDTAEDKSNSLLTVTLRDVSYQGLIPTVLIIAELSDVVPHFSSDRKHSECLLHKVELFIRKFSLEKEGALQTIAPKLEKAATSLRRSTKYLFGERPTYIDFVLAHIHKCCLTSADTATSSWPTLTYIGNLKELM